MLPLQGVKVLDLSRVLAGPYATMMLADLGAEVLKIERPELGDDTRHWGLPFAGGESAYFLSVNRNKRSAAVDLKDPESLERVKELAANADVLIENMRRGALEELGLGYETLKERTCEVRGAGGRTRRVLVGQHPLGNPPTFARFRARHRPVYRSFPSP